MKTRVADIFGCVFIRALNAAFDFCLVLFFFLRQGLFILLFWLSWNYAAHHGLILKRSTCLFLLSVEIKDVQA